MKVKCKYCETEFDKKPHQIKEGKNDFCCRSHAAVYNNKKYPKRTHEPREHDECLICKKSLKNKPITQKICSHECRSIFRYQEYIKRWLDKKESGYTGSGRVLRITNHVRKWVIDTRGEQCELCGWDKKHPTTNKVPIEIHHIDGNAKNNAQENLQILCPNCHSLTLTYAGLNRGNGRVLGDIQGAP